MIKKEIMDQLNDPLKLEKLYRSNKNIFKCAIFELAEEKPESKIIQFWKARFESNKLNKIPFQTLFNISLICIIAFLFLRLPNFFLDPEWFYPRFLPVTLFLSLAAYYQFLKFNSRNTLIIVGSALVVTTYGSLLPNIDNSDSAMMSILHLIPIGLSLFGISYLGNNLSNISNRISFIRMCGELFIICVLLFLGGGVFTLFTVGMFDLVGIDVENWYMLNVGLLGTVTIPICSAFLFDYFFKDRIYIASLLAKVFAPLFTMLALFYVIVMIANGKTPFNDREFLIIFNAFLILVLAIVSLSIISRDGEKPSLYEDGINTLLLVITISINALALAAILFRLFEFGISPNRFVVIGLNIIVFIHLFRLLFSHIHLFQGKSNIQATKIKVVDYLSVYVAWSVIVFFILPLIFNYQ